jgi:hypothetical protein
MVTTRKNGVVHWGGASGAPWCGANRRTATVTRDETKVTCKTCMRFDRMHGERVRRWRAAQVKP